MLNIVIEDNPRQYLALEGSPQYMIKTGLSFNFQGCELGIVPYFPLCEHEVGTNYVLAFSQPSSCGSSLPSGQSPNLKFR